jgi:arylsulfatase A-like enzyme
VGFTIEPICAYLNVGYKPFVGKKAYIIEPTPTAMPVKNIPLFHPCLLLCCFVPLFLSAQTGEQRPNIIYIMADDLGYADLSGYGRKDYQTPHLDALAAQGMKFTQAYAAAPVCTPTRVAFMTGRYPARTPLGLREPLEWSGRDSMLGLTPEYPSIASYLKAAGYATYLVGKWHLGFKPEYSPMRNGFDRFFGFHAGGVDYISHKAPKGGYADLYDMDVPADRQGYLTDILKEKALELLREPHPQPFFLALMFNAPHWPWQAPGDAPYADTAAWREGGSPATYAAMMKSLDDAVGELMKTLDEQELANNTIVIFTSDNGGERFSDMSPFKGHKMELWEGGTRVPAFVRWPGKIKAGSSTSQVATTMDWTATILSLGGATPRPDRPLDGIDLTNILTGRKKAVDRTLYWRISQRNQHKALRDGRWKYFQDEKRTEYLFNLRKDPSEKNNLKEKVPARFTALKHKYDQWETTVLKPIPLQ